MTCTSTTAKGEPCRRPALRGRDVCHAHSGVKVGRSSALTPEVHERLVQAKRLGCPGHVAARYAGTSETTYYELVKRGHAEESGPYRELLDAIERAEAEAYMRGMVGWNNALKEDWRAAKGTSSTRTGSEPPARDRRVPPRSSEATKQPAASTRPSSRRSSSTTSMSSW